MASYTLQLPWDAEETLMPTTLEALQAEVLRLSPVDRARLLDRLIASLDVDKDAEAAWDALADKREQELESGAVQPVALDVAIARLEARFPG
jgi:Putative addiction module component